MKISNLFITILCFAQIICSAQEEETDRKGRFLFSIGPEYRIAPFYEYQALTVNDANFSSYTNIDKQNSGLAVELGVEYFVTKKLSVGFSNSFRYNLVVSEFDEITGASGIKEADYKLLMDYSL